MLTMTKRTVRGLGNKKRTSAIGRRSYSPTICTNIEHKKTMDSKEYMKIQMKYQAWLIGVEKQQQRGGDIQAEKQIIINNLKAAGILDEEGNIAAPYRKDGE